MFLYFFKYEVQYWICVHNVDMFFFSFLYLNVCVWNWRFSNVAWHQKRVCTDWLAEKRRKKMFFFFFFFYLDASRFRKVQRCAHRTASTLSFLKALCYLNDVLYHSGNDNNTSEKCWAKTESVTEITLELVFLSFFFTREALQLRRVKCTEHDRSRVWYERLSGHAHKLRTQDYFP